MATTKAQQKAVNKYVRENYDRVLLTMPKGQKEVIRAHAQSRGLSVNAYILGLIAADMGDELSPPPAPHD